ncbi:uncharacterized protein LY89DRAFT_682245 [Mollisia scopiformis]|uniref:Uncharacterized protein n=1 Tax=Mollisia scopiformis TaxID=149040 RepID=A0A194XJW8_MOLSC|nr:uncharacterized protein LY89DRAFT_682245 [Mollisia scopiformis]KUJ20520.1 hypothetical protein LY89DRAFT_682245 [Mollisia scopiformis]
MHRGTETAINPALILLLFIYAGISSANILYDPPKHNPLNIDWDPAPSPEDGPPLSAHASRDPALIPAQVGAILGAYLFSVCVVGIALVLIGRKLRLSVQRAARALDIEMVHPAPIITQFNPTPLSPGGGPRNFSWPSPEKDTKNPYIYPSSVRSPVTPAGSDPYVDTRIVEADREMMDRDLEDIYAHVMEQEEAKKAGVNVKELPPPLLQKTGPVPMSAPQRTPKGRPSNLNFDEPKTKSRASSIISSLISPRKKGLRAMNISSPLATPMSATFPQSGASDEEPLTPKYYNPPPPPPIPKDQEPYNHSRQNSNGVSPTRTIDEQLSSMNLNPYKQHRPNPSQTSMDPTSATSTTSQTPLFPPPRSQKSTPQPPASNNSSTRALPFRQFEPAILSPSFAPTTKTTVLERTGPSHHGPNTAGLKTPWSAGATPYSPYQPFTPLVPMTPTLVTREERKARKKAEGRAPVLEMVKSADETWDSGY